MLVFAVAAVLSVSASAQMPEISPPDATAVGCKFGDLPTGTRLRESSSELPSLPASLQEPSTGGAVGGLLFETAVLNPEMQPRYDRAVGMLTELVQFWNPNVTSSKSAFELVRTEIDESGPAGAILLPLELIAESATIMGRPDVATVAVTALAEVNPSAATRLCMDFDLGQSVASVFPQLQSGPGMLAAVGTTRGYLLKAPLLRAELGEAPSSLEGALEGAGSALAAHSSSALPKNDTSNTEDKPDSMQCRLTCHDEATNASTWTAVKETIKNFGEDIWKLGQPDPEDDNDVDATPIEVLIDASRKASEEADEVYDERYKACVQENCEPEPEPPTPSPKPNTDDEPEISPLTVTSPPDDPNTTDLPPDVTEPTCNPAITNCPGPPIPNDLPVECLEDPDDPRCGPVGPDRIPE